MKIFFKVISFLLITSISFAQNKTLPNYSYIFSADSLSGFEDLAAKKASISDGFLGEEFKVRMWQLKRSYINTKYNINPIKESFLNSSYNGKLLVSAGCVNEDFESSTSGSITTSNQITGWTINEGTVTFPSNNCNLSTCCIGAPLEAQLITAPATGYIDPIIGSAYPIFSVFGTTPNTGLSANPGFQNMFGNNFIRINSSMVNVSIEKLSKTFVVTSANDLFQIAYIAVLFNAPHQCCDAQSFQIKLTNATTSMPLACPGFSTSGISSACSPTSTINFLNAGTLSPATISSNIIFNKWRITSLDLSAYIGQTITVDIIASDCTAGGHYGYAYIDAQCGSMSVQCNNLNTASAATTSLTLGSCGLTGFSVTAPAGFGPYSWAGPAVGPPYTTPSMFNQTFTTNVAGTVTLTMNPSGACGPIIKVITLSLTPAPATLTVTGSGNICLNATANFTVNGANTYSWSNGSNSNVLSVSPLASTNYTVATSDLNGCSNSASVSVFVNPLPLLSVSGVNTVCIGSSTNYTCSGATSYSLNALQVTNPVNILPASSGVFTISGASAANCVTTQTVSISVNTTCANVWPGDANSDGVANNLDVLELGLHFTQTGPARTATSNAWQSYFANNWVGLISNGKNLNHADCNGDGLVDLNDTLGIFNNYNLTHAFKSNNSIVLDPQLSVVSDQTLVHSGQWGTASVYLGDSVTSINNINGLAFDLNFDKTYLQFDSVYIEYPISFLNTNNQNLHFRKKQFLNGKLFAATTHTSNMDVSGNGKIAIFHYKINPNLGFDTLFHFNLSLANQSNSNGIITPLTIGASVTVAIGNTVGLKENSLAYDVYIFPNPTNGIVTVKSNIEIKKVEVLNITGQIILSENAKSNLHHLNLESFSKGIYFIKIYNVNGNVGIKKLVTKD